jgi:hypothetical protein
VNWPGSFGAARFATRISRRMSSQRNVARVFGVLGALLVLSIGLTSWMVSASVILAAARHIAVFAVEHDRANPYSGDYQWAL